MSDARPQLFLHVGCRKSGSSSLQMALRESTDELSRQGVRFWLVSRKTHARRLLRPLEQFREDGDREAALDRLRGLADAMVADEHPRHLLTIEDLAEQPPEVVDLVHEAFADLDLTVVVSARHWGRTLPSEWQQCLKERLTLDLPAFVDSVQAATPEAQALFLDRQDVPAIARRWQGALPASRVVVISVADVADRSTLLGDFCGLIGVEESTLTVPKVALNPSMGSAQAEVLRRLNVDLGERLPDYRRGGYWRVVRKGLVQQSLRNQRSGGRVTLPASYAAWCHDATTARLAELTAAGFTVLGRPEDLVSPATSAEDYEPPSAEEVAAVATRRWPTSPRSAGSSSARRRRPRSPPLSPTRTTARCWPGSAGGSARPRPGRRALAAHPLVRDPVLVVRRPTGARAVAAVEAGQVGLRPSSTAWPGHSCSQTSSARSISPPASPRPRPSAATITRPIRATSWSSSGASTRA